MQIIETPLDEIRPYKRNSKKHDAKQVANVAESIRQYGFVQPIVVDGDGVIVIGHCRYAAAKKLGMATVPVVRVDELTPEQVDALRAEFAEKMAAGENAAEKAATEKWELSENEKSIIARLGQ